MKKKRKSVPRRKRAPAFKWRSRQVEEIEWYDHASASGWRGERDVIESSEDRVLCRTVGWVLGENQHTITMIGSESSIGHCAETVYILKAGVVRRRKLRS